MASVYRARDDVLARTVAVKILHPHLGQDHAFLERFRIEALAAARLSHPSIVAIYDTGIDEHPQTGEPRHFIVMEYCGRGSLADHLEGQGPFESERVNAIGATVCEAIGYAHRAGIVHRDIKPGNVLVTVEGGIRVADFGIAKAAFARGDMTTTGAILGTVTYLSPEQLNGREPDARSDLYSLGCTLYELIAGRPPFSAETEMATAMQHMHESPPPLRSVRAGVPRSTESVIMTALEKDPGRRWQSADEMRGALEGGGVAPPVFVESATPPQGAPAVDEDATRISSTTRSVAPVVLLILIVAAATIGISVLVNNLREPANRGGGGPQAQGEGGGGGGGGAPPDGNEPLEIQGVADIDSAGGEHPEDAPLAVDGSADTSWGTETYEDAFELLGKSGVGLVVDLGSPDEVSEVRVSGCGGCALEIGASDSTSSTDESGFDIVSRTNAFSGETFEFEPVQARYWLVFITGLPGGGGGAASISEIELRGPS
jgi:hypothetical protein